MEKTGSESQRQKDGSGKQGCRRIGKNGKTLMRLSPFNNAIPSLMWCSVGHKMSLATSARFGPEEWLTRDCHRREGQSFIDARGWEIELTLDIIGHVHHIVLQVFTVNCTH